MLFNSAQYLLLFLPITLAVFLWLAKQNKVQARNLWLILASIVFYASWNPVYLALILTSIVVNFGVGGRIARAPQPVSWKWLCLGVAFNLGLLAYFKYTGFFLDSLNALGLWLIPLPEITLPLAISFFTFQQIAYLVDVHRKECEEYRFDHYALFVLFFPQLIAGPIVHHKEMMPQFTRHERSNLSVDLWVGLTIIAMGLFKKVVVADTMADISDPLFASAHSGNALSFVDGWIATLAFSFQIYFDFSGYSDMAIGSARLFGIRLPENFNSPYKSVSIIEAWRRWHMTLSRFLRDYLYIALGGNRKGPVRRYVNLIATMLLGGLWHGAAWTFVIWGGLHGAYLCINHAYRALVQRLGLQSILGSALLTPIYTAITFIAFAYAFVVFRAPDVATATTIVGASLNTQASALPTFLPRFMEDGLLNQAVSLLGISLSAYGLVAVSLLCAGIICWFLPNTQQLMYRYEPVLTAHGKSVEPHWLGSWKPAYGYTLATSVILAAGLLSLASVTEFIYFQF